jgi:hypothetical protein
MGRSSGMIGLLLLVGKDVLYMLGHRIKNKHHAELMAWISSFVLALVFSSLGCT